MRATAIEAARLAAAIHREASGTLGTDRWSEKGASDFVTEVDLEAERRIVATILARFPDHRILAEEGTGRPTGEPRRPGEPPGPGETTTPDASELLWVIDPLDGTTNWLHRYPEHAVSIAALDDRGLRVGVVLNSATGEEYAATRGGGATRDGVPIRVSAVSDLRLALVGTGFPFKRAELLPEYLDALGTVLRSTSGVRRAGAAALDLCAVACGHLDAFWEHWLMAWDVAAGALIVREAGGTFAPLPSAREETLRAAVASAGMIDAVFRGTDRAFPGADRAFPGTDRATRPAESALRAAGGFVAGNGLVDDAFLGLLRGGG